MAVTIQEVAKHAGVAFGTVVRYLNGAQLREKNHRKVEQAIKELGFKENVLAIAVIIENFTDIFSTSIVSAIERFLGKQRYNIIISDFERNPKELTERLNFFKNRAISGLIVFPSGAGNESQEVLQEYLTANIPVVIVDDMIPGIETDVVLVDNAHASFRAVEHLIHANHRKISTLAGPRHSYVAQERLRGGMEAMQTYDIPVQEEWIKFADFTKEGGYAAVKQLFSSSKRPSAIFSSNYHMTLGAVIALNELQINIPEEISFIGFDRFTALELIKPPLTVIEQPLELIGKTAGELILKRIRDDVSDFPQTVELRTKMLIRDSVQNVDRK